MQLRTPKLKPLLLGGLLLATSLMAGCVHRAQQGNVKTGLFADTPACRSNPYLQRYGCSLDKVEQAAESNDPDAEYALGYMYYYGIGTVKDLDTAIVWIKRAAEQGQPLAIQAMQLIRQSQFHEIGGVDAKQMLQKQPAASVERPKLKPAKVMSVQKSPEQLLKAKPQPQVLAVQQNPAQTLKYTLQLMGSSNVERLQLLMRDYDLGKQAHLRKTDLNGKPWFILTYGEFASTGAAKAAKQDLPPGVQALKPWVKPIVNKTKA